MGRALVTDLYELTMAASHMRHGIVGPATFSLFVGRLPPRRGFLVAAGLEDALEYLEGVRFDDDDRRVASREWLRRRDGPAAWRASVSWRRPRRSRGSGRAPQRATGRGDRIVARGTARRDVPPQSANVPNRTS